MFERRSEAEDAECGGEGRAESAGRFRRLGADGEAGRAGGGAAARAGALRSAVAGAAIVPCAAGGGRAARGASGGGATADQLRHGTKAIVQGPGRERHQRGAGQHPRHRRREGAVGAARAGLSRPRALLRRRDRRTVGAQLGHRRMAMAARARHRADRRRRRGDVSLARRGGGERAARRRLHAHRGRRERSLRQHSGQRLREAAPLMSLL